MFTKKEQIAARLILRTVNQGRKVIKADDLVAELQKEDEGAFWGVTSEAEKALSKFASENLIVRINENTYRILADISAIRGLILRESGHEAEEDFAAYDLDLEEITGSAWTLAEDNQTEQEDDEDEDGDPQENVFLQARRLELMRRKPPVPDGEDTENDEETENDGEESGEQDDDDDMPPEVYAISQKIDEEHSIIKSDGDYYLVPEGLEAGGTAVRFRILIQEDGVYLSDEGLALLALNDRVSFDAEGIDEQIGFIVDRYHIRVVGDDLRIKVDSPEAALSCMMQLYAAIERILTMDEEAIATCAEHDREDDAIWDAVKDFLKANPEQDREAIVSRMKEGYHGVKDAENFDDIILFARGVKEFARMSDEDYLQSRDFLLGRFVVQKPGEAEKNDAPAAAESAHTDTELLSESAHTDTELLSESVHTDTQLLSESAHTDTELSKETENAAGIITETLAGFHIRSEVVHVTVGPSAVRFELNVPDQKMRSFVMKRDGELAMRLKQRDGVRVFDDTKSGRVCIEVPRGILGREQVRADELIEHERAQWEKKNALVFALGKNMKREFVCGDMTWYRHILIGGAGGSGKSTFFHTMIFSFITKYSPDDVRLLLCGSKQAEVALYTKLPHLLTGQVITETEQLVHALHWAVKEMERRYQLFIDKSVAGERVRNIDEYNGACKEGEEKLPRLVILIDGYEDFVTVAKRDIEEAVQRLVQKSAAAGIHLVVATQRISDAAGILQTNFSTRIAFRMIQEADSRALLDESGAEKLLGLGDMLLFCELDFRYERIQGAYIPQEALVAAVAKSKETYEAKFDEKAKKYINRTDRKTAAKTASEEAAERLYIKALAIVIQAGEVSISFLQRKCHIGYCHAGEILEWMENKGYVSPFDQKAKARTVLLTKEEFLQLYGPIEE